MRVHGRVHLVTNVAAVSRRRGATVRLHVKSLAEHRFGHGGDRTSVIVILHRLIHRRLHDQIVTAGAATEINLHRSTRHWRRRGVQISVTAQRRLYLRRMGRRRWLRRRRR